MDIQRPLIRARFPHPQHTQDCSVDDRDLLSDLDETRLKAARIRRARRNVIGAQTALTNALAELEAALREATC